MSLKDERIQILKMVEDGKISSDEAVELMNAVENGQETIVKDDPKWLRVRVMDEKDNVKVKVNIPLRLVDIGIKLGTAFSPELKETGLKQEDLQEILEAVKNGAEGKIVDIEDEGSNTKVEVYVE